MGFELKDQIQSFSLESSSDKLKSILELLVTSHGIVTEETLNRLHEGNAMGGKLVGLEVIFEVPRLKSMPVDHPSTSLGLFLCVHERSRQTPREHYCMIQFDKWQLSRSQ